MTVLSRYISMLFFRNVLFLFSGLLAIIYLFDTLELLRRAVKQNQVGITTVLEMGLYKLPEVGQQLIPFAILFAAILTLWQLSRRQELIILRCAGLSAWRFLSPLFVSAAMIGVVYVTILHPFSAAMLSRYEVMQSTYLTQSKNLVTLSRDGLWLKERDSEGEIIIYAASVAVPEWTMNKVMALFFDNHGNNYQRVDAQFAHLEDGQWVFEQTTVNRPGQPALRLPLYTMATEMTVEDIQESFSDPETISFWKLRDFIDTLNATGLEATGLEIYYQNLLSQPLMLASMILIAAAVSLRPPRSGRNLILLMGGIGAGFAIFFLSSFLKALGTTHQIPVMLSAWAPSLICTFIGTGILMRTEDG